MLDAYDLIMWSIGHATVAYVLVCIVGANVVDWIGEKLEKRRRGSK